MVGPAIERLSKSMNGKIKIAKLNFDENQIGRSVRSAPKEKYQQL